MVLIGCPMGAKYSRKRHKPRISKTQIPWLLRGAIRSNNVGTLQYLFSYPNGVDPSMVIDGVCPLNLAIELGYLQMVKILIKAGADIHVADAPRYPLHQASLYGRCAIAELLICSGASVSALTERRQSCLHLLAHQSAQRFVETAHVLLRYAANPNILDDDGLAPLHRASVEMVHVLVSHEATDVNICSRDGDTPLLIAVKDRRESFLFALLRAEQQFWEQHVDKLPSDVNLPQTVLKNTDEQYQSMTFTNIRTSSSKSTTSTISRLTLASTASAIFQGTCSSNDQQTVLRASSAASVNLHSILNVTKARYKYAHALRKVKTTITNNIVLSPTMAKTLSSATATCSATTHTKFKNLSVNHNNFVQETNRSPINKLIKSTISEKKPTHHLIPHLKVKSVHSGSANLFRINRKTEICQRCHSVGNPTDVAGWWQMGSVKDCELRSLSKKLLNRRVSVQQPATIPIHQSIHHIQPHSVASRPRLDLDRPDKIGMTPLMIAAEAGSNGLSMVVALINAGCNTNITDKLGMTAVHHACYVGSLNMVRVLMEYNLTASGLTSAMTISSMPNSSVNTTILHSPIGMANTTTTNNVAYNSSINNLFLELNPKHQHVGSPNLCNNNISNIVLSGWIAHPELLNLQDKYGRTLIYLAASRGHTEVVNYLLCHSANLHIPNKEHKSPLYISAYFGYLEIANVLLRHGAQVDQTDSHLKTPLYVATYHGRVEIVDLLLEAGANVNLADKNGKTPLYIAVLHGHLQLARKLLDWGASINRVDHEGLGPLHMAVKFPKLDLPMIKLLLNYGCDPVNLASFTKWLLVHGIIPEEYISGDQELAQWLKWEESNVKSLKRICRVQIQRHIGCTDSMKSKINRLPLPDDLISYLSMKEL